MIRVIVLIVLTIWCADTFCQSKDSLITKRLAWHWGADIEYLSVSINYPNQAAENLGPNKLGHRVTVGLITQKKLLQAVEWHSRFALGYYQQSVNFLRASSIRVSGSFVTDAEREGIIDFSDFLLSFATHFRIYYVDKPQLFIAPGLFLDRVIGQRKDWNYQRITFYDEEGAISIDPPVKEQITGEFQGRQWKYGFGLEVGTMLSVNRITLSPSLKYQFAPFDLGFDNTVQQHAFGINCKVVFSGKSERDLDGIKEK
ncbi:MAG: hypothetical protein AAFQ92_21845 [Bacteroidota bacterium]